jgi:hypothetical protein
VQFVLAAAARSTAQSGMWPSEKSGEPHVLMAMLVVMMLESISRISFGRR